MSDDLSKMYPSVTPQPDPSKTILNTKVEEEKSAADVLYKDSVGSANGHYGEALEEGLKKVADHGLLDTKEVDQIRKNTAQVFTDLKIDWGGLRVSEVFPRQLPDLFPGRPVILTGRFAGAQDSVIGVTGTAAGESVKRTIPANVIQAGANHRGLPEFWARMKIADLADQSIYEPGPDWAERIKRVALDYGIMSAFTAFVAVDSARRTEGTQSTTVPVAVPVPEGVNYDTTVKEKQP